MGRNGQETVKFWMLYQRLMQNVQVAGKENLAGSSRVDEAQILFWQGWRAAPSADRRFRVFCRSASGRASRSNGVKSISPALPKASAPLGGERAGTDLNPEELLGARGYGEWARIARSEGLAIPERLYPPKK